MAGGEYRRLRYKDPGPTDLITQRVNALRVSIPIRAPNRRDFTFPTWSHFPRRGIIETCDDIGPCPIIGSASTCGIRPAAHRYRSHSKCCALVFGATRRDTEESPKAKSFLS